MIYFICLASYSVDVNITKENKAPHNYRTEFYESSFTH